jgi:lipopolysaccharide/colanic/teichoic acid biosynthesis glycosyltransferase
MSELESNPALMLKTAPTINDLDVGFIQGARVTVDEKLAPDRASFFRWKYRFDRIAASFLIVVFAPLMMLLCILIKLTSPGPAFYRQVRVGLDGELFEIFKLRSMIQDAEKEGEAVWCVKNDPRITWFGRFLRKFHLDELPQLINVVRGEMSFVGPRPERPEICEKLSEDIDTYYRRVIVRPGVTGLAQINLPPDQEVEDAMRKQVLDLCYIDQANVWLDTRMLIATALRMLGIKGEIVMRLMYVCRRDLVREHEYDMRKSSHVKPFFNQEDESWLASESDEDEYAFPMSGLKTDSTGLSAEPRQPR